MVSMRPYKPEDIERVRAITRPYLETHGEPIAWVGATVPYEICGRGTDRVRGRRRSSRWELPISTTPNLAIRPS